MAEYIQVSENLQIRADAAAQVSLVDAVIFDIDGVLIDVKGSFRETIRETVQYYLKKTYDLDSPQILVTPDDINVCKLAGSFNNDWDVAEAIVAFYVAKIIRHKVRHLLELKKLEPTVAAFLQSVKEAGGGVANAYTVLYKELNNEEQNRLRQDVRRKEIVEIFQELYGGINYCQRLYHRRPVFFRGEGRIEREKIILKKEMIFKDLFKYGVLTGRTKEETELALEQLGLGGYMEPGAIVYEQESIKGKPHPDGLIKISDHLQNALSIYCGDIVDDWTVVKNYRLATGKPMCFCYCQTGLSDEATLELFKQEGIEIIARDINDLLTWLVLQKKGEAKNG